MFHSISVVIFLYTASRLLWPLSISRKAKTAGCVLLLLVAQSHLITRTFFGTMASPELPAPVLLTLGWLFAAFILLALLFFIKDAVSLVLWLTRKAGALLAPRVSGASGASGAPPSPPSPSSPPSPAGRRAGQWAAAFVSTALLLSACGVGEAVRVPDVRTVEVTLSRLPSNLDGLTLVQITDLHASSLLQGPRVRAVVDKVNALEPDLILLTGDMIDGTPAARAEDVAPLRDLRAAYGVFACMGNHEYYSDYAVWLQTFKDLGLIVLANEHVVLDINGEVMVLAGTTDRVAERFNRREPDIRAALANAPENALRVLMAHQPRGVSENARSGVDLQLSGHTHGGQITALYPLIAWFNEGYVSGLYDIEDMRLYVSPGAGLWSGFPVRLGVPAEISRIILRSGSNPVS